MASNNANTALVERDIEHLIHPLHNRGLHGGAPPPLE